jgi:hypothetical protein
MIESSALLVDTVLPYEPMRQWVLSVPYPLRFLFASNPHVMGKVLKIVYRIISTYLIKKTGYNKKSARTGAVTLIQRFGSALNLNIHFHMLFLDGVYLVDETKNSDLLGKIEGFSLHAGVSAKAHQRDKLERLCRYILRPPVAEHRLSLTSSGKVCYELKTTYRDGTTYVLFEPLDFISKLAALVPLPRVNLTRFHGVFAPNSKHRAAIIMKKVDKKSLNKKSQEETKTESEKRRAMSLCCSSKTCL